MSGLLATVMHVVGPAVYHPAYASKPESPLIAAFALDETPVTNRQFLVFVGMHPEWQRGRVTALFADGGYLGAWASPTTLGDAAGADAPVVSVSWFAARAYCQARGAALPTTAQWEVAASASRTAADAGDDPAYTQEQLDWYAKPNPARLPAVGQSPPNVWGVRDLIGLVWEWTDDFNGEIIDPKQFCGGGAVDATDAADYPAIARAEFRSSLRAAYTMQNLGFRCAAPVDRR